MCLSKQYCSRKLVTTLNNWKKTVIRYFSKTLKTMKEFKYKIRAMYLSIPDFIIPPDQVVAFMVLPQETVEAKKQFT